jgi:hypothetical protein
VVLTLSQWHLLSNWCAVPTREGPQHLAGSWWARSPLGGTGRGPGPPFQGVTVRLSRPPTLALISAPEPGTGTPPDEQGQQAGDERAERDGQGDQAS